MFYDDFTLDSTYYNLTRISFRVFNAKIYFIADISAAVPGVHSVNVNGYPT